MVSSYDLNAIVEDGYPLDSTCHNL